MNEQIKEFWEQATQHADQVVVYTPHVDRVHPGYFDAKAWTEVLQGKFAELIVKECAKVACYHTPDTEELEYSHLIEDKILKHFGVEE
jgi:hypothetical protein